MPNVTLKGTLASGPQTASDTTIPSGVTLVDFSASKSNPTQASGIVSPADGAAFHALGGIDATIGPVKQGVMLYLRTSAPMEIRLTQYNALGDTVQIVKVQGLCIIEFDPTQYLKLVEVKGVGNVEYLALGAA